MPMLPSARRFAGLLLLWSLPGLVSWLQVRAWSAEARSGSMFVWYYTSWVVAAFLIPPLAWVLRRATPERVGRVRTALAYVASWVAFVSCMEGFMAALSRVAGPVNLRTQPLGTVFVQMVRSSVFLDTLAFVMSVGVLLAVDLRRRLRTQELAAARLEAELARAELDALRVQLHPHFLFNTLNAISMLVRKGQGDTAVRMIAGLSDLLRIALATAGEQEVPLQQELDFLERYLSLQQIRFPDRLRIEMRIAPDTLDARVPSLVLQPLAENAVRHGIAPAVVGGAIEVSASRDGDRLVLSVRDTGVGLRPGAESPGGVGLKNVRARLQHLYPGQHLFQVVNRAEGGVESLLAIPYRGPEVARA